MDALFANNSNGWKYDFGLAAVPGLILFVGFWFCPESPRWLLQISHHAQAREVLKKLRSSSCNVEEVVPLHLPLKNKLLFSNYLNCIRSFRRSSRCARMMRLLLRRETVSRGWSTPPVWGGLSSLASLFNCFNNSLASTLSFTTLPGNNRALQASELNCRSALACDTTIFYWRVCV